jgi:hypothetical protein
MIHAIVWMLSISFACEALDGGSDDTRMDDQSFHLAQCTTLPPPRARVTATPKPILG